MSKVLFKCAMNNLKILAMSKITENKKKSFQRKRKIFIVSEKDNLSQNLFGCSKMYKCNNLKEGVKWRKNLNMG